MKKVSIVGTASLLVMMLSLFLLLQISACGGGGGGGGSETGVLQAKITDAPPAPATFAQVHVTVVKVVAVPAGKEDLSDNDSSLPVVASFPGGLGVDILNLHFIPQLLGSATVPAGKYTQVRLILAPNQPTLSNYVTTADNPNRQLPLTTPSAQETGLKIVGNFTVTPGVINTILLDFNPNSAIVVAGNSGQVILKPTGIRIIQIFNSLDNAGAVTGEIRSPAFRPWSSAAVTVAPRNPAGGAVSSGVVFSNFSSPGVWKAPFTAFLPPNGSSAVPAGSYKVFVQAYRSTTGVTPVFALYSSPLFTVASGVDTPVPPAGVVLLAP